MDGAKWNSNGTISTSSAGLTSMDANGGSAISKIGTPDETYDYEVKRQSCPSRMCDHE